MAEYGLDFEARRGLDSRSLYIERQYYKNTTTDIFSSINNNYIDLWYDVPFYGKVNREGSLIVPKKEFFGYGAKDNLVSFEFVLKAFEEFRFFLKRAIYQGHTSLQDLFGDFQVKSSFEDSVERYFGYSGNIVNIFNESLASSGKVISNPKSYTLELLRFLKKNNFVFSFYSFFASQLTSVQATALTLELRQGDFSEDVEKNKYFRNQEFDKYSKAAAQFGFRINKNAPWMLIADLNSKPMQLGRTVRRRGEDIKIDGYLAQSLIPSIDYLFETQYDKAIDLSYFILKVTLFNAYSEFQNQKKHLITSGKTILNLDPSSKSITGAEIVRTPDITVDIEKYTFNEFLEEFADCYFLRVFEKILMMEYKTRSNTKYKHFRKRFLKQSKDIAKTYDTLEMLEKFYNPTAVYDPKSRKPLWTVSKGKRNFLTFANTGDMIPSEKEKPTVNKIVTEFYTGY